ncbi:MAG: hypothetical protein OXR66_00810 [Candidatus Woesearchaeota archaeon]|nr:hypothetical protein [Candidatus Woesearchaeota archaeon]
MRARPLQTLRLKVASASATLSERMGTEFEVLDIRPYADYDPCTTKKGALPLSHYADDFTIAARVGAYLFQQAHPTFVQERGRARNDYAWLTKQARELEKDPQHLRTEFNLFGLFIAGFSGIQVHGRPSYTQKNGREHDEGVAMYPHTARIWAAARLFDGEFEPLLVQPIDAAQAYIKAVTGQRIDAAPRTPT